MTLSVSNRSGFTMLETAVVLGIIALLIGGFMTTSTLIKTAKLRGVTADAQQYLDAVTVFRDKYDALPGDFTGATTMWGTATCPNGADTTGATCNGDGNGVISTTAQEIFRAWQHMANAGYVGGKFTGAGSGTSYTQADPGGNIPNSGIAGGGFTLLHTNTISSSLSIGNTAFHALLFGTTRADAIADNPLLSVAETLSIDRKIDDGQPNSGTIVTYRNTGSWVNCTNGTSYTQDATDNATCNLIFVAPF